MLSFWGVKPEIVKFIHPEFFEDKFSLHETFFIHQSHKKVPYWSKSSSFRIHKTNPCSTKSENILVRWTRRDDRFFPQINGPQKTTGFCLGVICGFPTGVRLIYRPTGPWRRHPNTTYLVQVAAKSGHNPNLRVPAANQGHGSHDGSARRDVVFVYFPGNSLWPF